MDPPGTKRGAEKLQVRRVFGAYVWKYPSPSRLYHGKTRAFQINRVMLVEDMPEPPTDLVRIDDTGTAHPVSRTASQKLRARTGTFRLMPGPVHIVFMRYVGEDGKRDEEDGAVVKLAGEVITRGTLCDVVSLIDHAGWKGELVVMDGLTSRSIFFDHGHVIGAHSTAEGERLGEILYQYGALTAEQVESCTQIEGKRFGDAAVELGFITRDKLYQLMGKQSEEIVFKTLLVGDGMFYFLDRYDESRLMSRHNISAAGLLMEGVRRMDETSYFRERIPSDEYVPVRVPGKADPQKELLKVWNSIDGEKSITELGRHCEMALFEITQSIFQLCQSGHAQVRPPKPTDPDAITERFNGAMRIIFKAVEESGSAENLRQTLASFASSSGVYDALFMFAGPHEDGTVRTERVVTNISSLAGDDTIRSLSQWLYEYAAFALFAASSLVSPDVEQTLSRQLAELLSPLRQDKDEPMSTSSSGIFGDLT
jgi:hypothetical protein